MEWLVVGAGVSAPVKVATLSLSKTGVTQREAYSVSLTVPGGFPEGANVQFRYSGYMGPVLAAEEGSTVITMPGASHAAVGSNAWYADVVTTGGTTTFGPVTQSVTSSAYNVTLPSGATRSEIQRAMDEASKWFMENKAATVIFDDATTMATVKLVEGGTYTLDRTLHYRRGVRLIGGGSGATRPLVYAPASESHLFNGDDNGGGGYNAPHFDWLVENIRFDCRQWSGGFSIAHVRRFRIKGCDFTNLGGKKHYIEINASGGPRTDGKFNCEVIKCYFTMPLGSLNPKEERRAEDECVQLDYSWKGAASNVANDGTCAHNVLISGCTFDMVPRAVGAHHYVFGAKGKHDPLDMTANIRIESCTFNHVDPEKFGDGSHSERSEGAVRAYHWRLVQIIGCTFISCHHPISFYIPDHAEATNGNPGEYLVSGCTFKDSTSSSHPIINAFSANAKNVHQQILVENNTVRGVWSTDNYFVTCEHTGKETLPGSSGTVVIRGNCFRPKMSLEKEKDYNKYRAKGESNAGPVLIESNTVSDGSVDNS